MHLKIRLQLSTLMFLQYFVWGAWYVTISTYLTSSLQFKPVEVGLVFGTFSIAAMISPFFVGLVADKFFPTERTLGVLHLLGAIILEIVQRTGIRNYHYCFCPYMYSPFFLLQLDESFPE